MGTNPSPTVVISISDGTPSGKTNHVNALNANVRQFIKESLENAWGDSSVTSIILIGRRDGKGAFSAGADIKEFSGSGSNGNVTSSEQDGAPTLNDLAYLIESSPKPVVAALTGACLGGGMELALAAQYRVADNTLKYGLPEVKIGLIPGAGGTQRLPRLTGVRYSLDVIARGRINGTAEEGLKVGFLDGVASIDGSKKESILSCALRWATWTSNLPLSVLEKRRISNRVVPPDSMGVDNGDMCDFALRSLPLKERGGESSRAAVEAIMASFMMPFQKGMAVEKDLFNDLLYHSLQGRAYRHIFFAERSSSSISKTKISHQSKTSQILMKGSGHIGVIGAGTMGRGIAISFLRGGFGPVVLVDVNPKVLEAGVNYIQSVLQREEKKGHLSDSELEKMLVNLQSSSNLSSLAGCDLVVEAAYENLQVKSDIFSKLNVAVKKKDAFLLSNTSTLNVDTIASSLPSDRRPFCAGMHFFSPAHMMKLVEIVRGAVTSNETLQVIHFVAKRMKKVPIVVGNCDGFVGNRMLFPYTTESTLLLEQYGNGPTGLNVSDVDDALGPNYFGMAVGPFVMSDIAGNDIGYNIRREKGLARDPKTGVIGRNRTSTMRYTELADEMVEKLGRVGQKVQKGWYDYDLKIGKGRKPLLSSEVQELISKYSRNFPHSTEKLEKEKIVQRVLYPLVNEGLKILDEGIAAHPSDIDVVYLYGYGWPAWKGGPMFWADNYVGLPKILSELEELYQKYPGSDYFYPSDLLRKCVDAGMGVQDYFQNGLAKSDKTLESKL